MADQASPTNAVASFFGSVIKAAVVGGEDAAMLAIGAACPFLVAGPMAMITSYVLGLVVSPMQGAITSLVTLAVLDAQTNLENSSAVQAAKALQAAQISGDPIALQKATQAAVSAYAALASSDGTYTPS